MTYDIGYRRPPTKTQFKKGDSGNPKGRPKGSKNVRTVLEQELAKPITITENGRKKTVPRLDAIVKRMVTEALQGDQKSRNTIFRMLDHAAPETVAETVAERVDQLEAERHRHVTEAVKIAEAILSKHEFSSRTADETDEEPAARSSSSQGTGQSSTTP